MRVKERIRKNRGITLVALIITIVVLVILAAVTISALAKLDIINIAIKGADKYEEEQYKEQEELEKINEKLEKIKVSDEALPENTEDVEEGTLVRGPDKWKTQTQEYLLTEDGVEIVKTKISGTVYAVSAGNGETIPVPYGFYYVGGNLSTGVIISDNEEDGYEKGKDKTTWEYTMSLKGNQFVWIPCEASEYKKRDWGSSYQNSNWDTTIPASEITQVKKYGGFYVARYEAGLASNIEEFTDTQTHTGSNQVYNRQGVPQSKAGKIPWMFIGWTNAKANAESMYNTDYANSGLITGTQWDVMLKKMVQYTDLTESDMTDSSKWGNYRNTQIAYKGRIALAENKSGTWYLSKFGEIKTRNNKLLWK